MARLSKPDVLSGRPRGCPPRASKDLVLQGRRSNASKGEEPETIGMSAAIVAGCQPDVLSAGLDLLTTLKEKNVRPTKTNTSGHSSVPDTATFDTELLDKQPEHTAGSEKARETSTSDNTIPLEESIQVDAPPAKGGRGRPKKSLGLPTVSAISNDPVGSENSGIEATALENPTSVEDSVYLEVPPPKRGRGRPKKSLDLPIVSVSPHGPATILDTRSVLQPIEDSVGIETSEKRGPGGSPYKYHLRGDRERIPAQHKAAATTSNHPVNQVLNVAIPAPDTTIIVKRGRGRPRKQQSTETIEAMAVSESAVHKKGIARPISAKEKAERAKKRASEAKANKAREAEDRKHRIEARNKKRSHAATREPGEPSESDAMMTVGEQSEAETQDPEKVSNKRLKLSNEKKIEEEKQIQDRVIMQLNSESCTVSSDKKTTDGRQPRGKRLSQFSDSDAGGFEGILENLYRPGRQESDSEHDLAMSGSDRSPSGEPRSISASQDLRKVITRDAVFSKKVDRTKGVPARQGGLFSIGGGDLNDNNLLSVPDAGEASASGGESSLKLNSGSITAEDADVEDNGVEGKGTPA